MNSILDVNQYTLPRCADNFTILAGGATFSTLEISDAYNQLLQDEGFPEIII